MNIFLANVLNSDILSDELKEHVNMTDKISKADAMIMDWNDKFYEKMTSLIKNNPKTKFVIYDRFLSITINKAEELIKHANVILAEPALNFRRKYFHYIPYWIKNKTLMDIPLNKEKRKYDIIYKGGFFGEIKTFRKYYVEYAKEWVNKIHYESDLPDGIETSDLCHDMVKTQNLNFKDSKSTIIIGSQSDYDIGYLTYNFIEALNNNCIPIMIPEHKYYSTMLPYKVKSIFDIMYLIESYDATYVGIIKDIYDAIENYYPEMLTENVAKQLINLLKEN